ncbi:BTB/POZ domain-containing protein [Ditylenchus destructor]|uniref:BTB/POZ domain-containing protein n=1 Tax=Ditylenchus destructor TaxID=166010 RepID=A0AAD4MUX0_9BILA|nr:BTB/POZ domain-containing protein [Ditylenchus destructor]
MKSVSRKSKKRNHSRGQISTAIPQWDPTGADTESTKSSASLELHIDSFKEFTEGTFESHGRKSEPKYIHGLPWKIYAMPREWNSHEKSLGFYLECNIMDSDPTWRCKAAATLRIVSQKDGVDHKERQYDHILSSEENDWGWSQFSTLEFLLDLENGFVKDDTIVLQVDFTAEEPYRIRNCKEHHVVTYEETFDSVDKTEFFSSHPVPYPWDFVLEVEGEEVHVEKRILSMHSEYFKDQFREHFKVHCRNRASLKNIGYSEFIELLCVIYPTIHSITVDNVETISKLADTFKMPEVLKHCEVFLMAHSSKFQKGRLLLIAQRHSMTYLQKQCIQECDINDIKQLKNAFEYTFLTSATKRLLLDRIEAIASTEICDIPSPANDGNAAEILDQLASSTSYPSDGILVVEDKHIPIHKALLSIYSDYFKTMFEAKFKESGQHEIELKEVGYNEILELLLVIYPSSASITDKNVETILKLSDRYLMPTVLDRCKNELERSTTIKGTQKLRLTQLYHLTELQERFEYQYKYIDEVENMEARSWNPEHEPLDDEARAKILDEIIGIER